MQHRVVSFFASNQCICMKVVYNSRCMSRFCFDFYHYSIVTWWVNWLNNRLNNQRVFNSVLRLTAVMFYLVHNLFNLVRCNQYDLVSKFKFENCVLTLLYTYRIRYYTLHMFALTNAPKIYVSDEILSEIPHLLFRDSVYRKTHTYRLLTPEECERMRVSYITAFTMSKSE